ncbi:unnamed protein product [Lactuca virosa]|uniref:Glycosyl transferase family 28 C-terminal domain-containing protein n=1 Tax=Lactuca virosa TaxID=75947 RepID=A0AAU9NB35_9ASTR|nr:unnamed protein product [Lactuca virosa]
MGQDSNTNPEIAEADTNERQQDSNTNPEIKEVDTNETEVTDEPVIEQEHNQVIEDTNETGNIIPDVSVLQENEQGNDDISNLEEEYDDIETGSKTQELFLHTNSLSLYTGSIFETLRLAKPLIVVVNEDLMDNHQSELAQELAQRNLLFCAIQSLESESIIPYHPGDVIPVAKLISRYLGFPSD